MTEKAAVSRAVRDAWHYVASNRRDADNLRLHVHIAEPKARVMLLPGRFRGADYVKRHVASVLTRDAEQDEQHVRRNLRALRLTLEEMGVDRDAIDAEVRRVEGAVRAEIWKRVLLPGGDE